ncbi:LysR family transcriptional regulator [Paenibacillus monticola]|uniref:LysR family transcriptional regulator n=1 Tax=Paenibacillus monticola TaxID=2666075 RepID=A0A7X2H6I5_9BACL|nr:LysR family transcriptional regulator [Paenibacillus monticola]MRN54446.1 LysR family transcriptional regulator [Paenibacillus monticola]
MNIMKLQIVVLIEKYKKVTDVAAELGLKQPTVSFHMKNLESELGTSLFEYRSGRVLLTDAGRALHQYAVKIVSLAADAERSVKQSTSTSQGSLELEAGYIPATYILPKSISQFMNINLGVQFSLSVQSDALVRERLRSREIQLAVLHSTDWSDESFSFQLIARDEAVLIFAPGHHFEGVRNLTPEQVAREPWIQHVSGSSLRGTADRWAQLNNVRLWNRAELNSPASVKGIIREGGTVGIYSRAGIEAELALGQLKFTSLPGILPENSGFVLAWRKDHTLTPVQQAFADLLTDSR